MPAVDRRRRSAVSAPSHRPITSVVHEKAKPTRHRLTLQDKLDVIEFCEQNQGRLSQADMATTLHARGYGTIVQSTISTWLDQKDGLQEQANSAKSACAYEQL
ncbi:hypothetical protein FRC12_011570 [Ceratobasidium sp. 428]|nr:hypothetical protein FRC12_011570 [Ceratobasidium sp. 428]